MLPLSSVHEKSLWLLVVFSGLAVLIFAYALLSPESDINAASSPVVNSATIAETSLGTGVPNINLTEDTTKNVYIHGTFTDEDGCGDVKTGGSLQVVFYRSTVSTTYTCGANNLYCYKGSYSGQCSITNCDAGTELTANYECVLPIQYYADATDVDLYQDANWTAYVEAKDNAQTSGAITSSTEINSISALQLEGSLLYGTLSFGATSTQQSITIKNSGNTTIDVNLAGQDMLCTGGGIATANQHYSMTSGTEYAAMSVLSTSTTRVETNLIKFNGNDSTTSLYFVLKMPETGGAAGVCSGVNALSAIAN